MWKASSSRLPTKVQLREKYVDVSELRQMYNACRQSIMHVFVTCSFVVQCWNTIGIKAMEIEQVHFAEWLTYAFESKQQKMSLCL